MPRFKTDFLISENIKNQLESYALDPKLIENLNDSYSIEVVITYPDNSSRRDAVSLNPLQIACILRMNDILPNLLQERPQWWMTSNLTPCPISYSKSVLANYRVQSLNPPEKPLNQDETNAQRDFITRLVSSIILNLKKYDQITIDDILATQINDMFLTYCSKDLDGFITEYTKEYMEMPNNILILHVNLVQSLLKATQIEKSQRLKTINILFSNINVRAKLTVDNLRELSQLFSVPHPNSLFSSNQTDPYLAYPNISNYQLVSTLRCQIERRRSIIAPELLSGIDEEFLKIHHYCESTQQCLREHLIILAIAAGNIQVLEAAFKFLLEKNIFINPLEWYDLALKAYPRKEVEHKEEREDPNDLLSSTSHIPIYEEFQGIARELYLKTIITAINQTILPDYINWLQEKNNIETLKVFFKQRSVRQVFYGSYDAYLNQPNSNKPTILHAAIREGDEKFITNLLGLLKQKGKSINTGSLLQDTISIYGESAVSMNLIKLNSCLDNAQKSFEKLLLRAQKNPASTNSI